MIAGLLLGLAVGVKAVIRGIAAHLIFAAELARVTAHLTTTAPATEAGAVFKTDVYNRDYRRIYLLDHGS